MTYLIIFLTWWGYRSWLSLPIWIDELVVKPVVFIGIPIIVGYRLKDKIKAWSVVNSLIIGSMFGVVQIVMRWLKVGQIIFHWYPMASLTLVGTTIAEELLFRGYILGELEKKHKASMSILISAALLAAIHVPVFVKNPDGILVGNVVMVMISGMLYGVLRVYFGNIWPAVAAHLGEDVVLSNFY